MATNSPDNNGAFGSEMSPFRGSRPVPDPTALTNELVEKATKALGDRIDARIMAVEDRITLVDANMARHVDIAVQTLENLANAKIAGNAESISVLRTASEKRLEIMIDLNKRTEIELMNGVRASQSFLDEKIKALTETVSVFKTSVNERFQLGDVQTEKAARDVKSAVDAAFAAAKEAVGEQNKSNALSIAKSEVATTKQIDQLAENARLSVKNADDKIGDLKDRILAIEAKASIADPSTTLALRDLADAISKLRTSSDQGTGQRQQSREGTALIFSIIAAVGVIGFILIDIFKGLSH